MANDETGKTNTLWMTVAQAADYLQVAVGTVRNWTSAKYVPFVKRGGVVRYHRDDLDQWLRRGQCRGRVTVADGRRGKAAPDASAVFKDKEKLEEEVQ